MTATLEAPIDTTALNYQMPKPCRGQAVTWFAHGVSSGPGEVAFVLEIGKRTIVVQRASGVCMDSVRHIDDPKLKLSEEQRETGAWDFTDQDKQLAKYAAFFSELEKRFGTVESRLAALEELFNEPTKKQKAEKA